MDIKKILKLAVYAGELMLVYGAETNRVEDTIRRICKNGGLKYADSFVTPTGIFVSIENEKGEVVSIIRRINARGINLEKVAEINDLSRRFERGEISIDDGYSNLKKIESEKEYGILLKTLSGGIGSAFFTLIFGGTTADFFNTLITATIVQFVLLFISRYKLSLFFSNIVGGLLTAALSILIFKAGLGSNINNIIIGAVMIMVPGVALTNAIRDTISGDLVSGASRAEEALVIALAVATGAGFILNIYLKFWR